MCVIGVDITDASEAIHRYANIRSSWHAAVRNAETLKRQKGAFACVCNYMYIYQYLKSRQKVRVWALGW